MLAAILGRLSLSGALSSWSLIGLLASCGFRETKQFVPALKFRLDC
jgi:hypothetical protein